MFAVDRVVAWCQAATARVGRRVASPACMGQSDAAANLATSNVKPRRRATTRASRPVSRRRRRRLATGLSVGRTDTQADVGLGGETRKDVGTAPETVHAGATLHHRTTKSIETTTTTTTAVS